MRINSKLSVNKSLLELNIGLIEASTPTFKNFTPKEGNTENNPEKSLKTVSSQSMLSKNSSKGKLHTQFSKY